MMKRSFNTHHILSFLLLFCCGICQAGVLKSEVDRTNIQRNETITLTITYDEQVIDEPDFSDLDIDFESIHHNQSRQFSSINGKSLSQTRWQIILAPKRSGKLIIPSFSLNGRFSEAINIHVSDQPATQQQKSTQTNKQDVYLQSHIDKESVYVQEQVLLTLKLYYRIPLSSYDPGQLTIDNSSITFVGKEDERTQVSGTTYNVLTLRYAIHPQVSGQMIIPAQTWQLKKNIQSLFSRQGRHYLRLQTQEHRIHVKPIAAISSQHWLPSTKVSLEPKWQPSTTAATVGEPLTYTLTLKAQGLQASQLPEITLDNTDGLTIYEDQPESDTNTHRDGVTGIKTLRYALVPERAGQINLPAVSLRWWNIQTDQEEVITLNATAIHVKKAPKSKQLPEIPPPSTAQTPVIEGKGKRLNSAPLLFWQLTCAVLAILCLLLLYCLYRRSTPKPIHQPPKAMRLNPSLYQDIAHAVEQQQWQHLQTLLLQWASLQQDKKVTGLQHIAQDFPPLAQSICQLQALLYAHDQQQAQTTALSNLVKLLKQQAIKEAQKAPSNSTLKPLY